MYVEHIVTFDEHLAILRVAGDEDRSTCGGRRCALSAALRATRDVVVDLSELRFADSSLMVDLAVLAQRLRARGGGVVLRGAQPQVQWLIERVGLHRQPAVWIEAPAYG